jgi:ribosomal protein L7/L12
MASREIVLRPGESIVVRFELGGHAMRMDLSLTSEGVAVSGASAAGAPTVFGGAPPQEPAQEGASTVFGGAPPQEPAPEGAPTVFGGVPPTASDADVEWPDDDPTDDDGFVLLDEDETDADSPEAPTVLVRPAGEAQESEEDVEAPEPDPGEEETWSPPEKLPEEVDGPDPTQEGVTLFHLNGPEEPVVQQASGKEPDSDKGDTLPEWKGRARTYREPGRDEKKQGDGTFHVFLSATQDKTGRKAAAQIIAEVQGIGMKEAVALLGNKVVPVARGISESEAGAIKKRLKESGLSCRITQKRN